MITATDLGWTAQQVTDFIGSYEDPVVSFILEAYNISVSQTSDVANGAGSDVSHVDGIVVNDVVVRAWNSNATTIAVETLQSEDAGDQSWSTSSISVSALDVSVPPSLAASGDTARIFYYTGANVRYAESTNKGSTWPTDALVAAVTNLEYLAATSLTTVHYIRRTTYNNLRLGVLTYSGSWSASESDIYWPFMPTSFDAVACGQYDDGAASSNDIIAMTTDLPPLLAVRTDGTELVHYYERVYGIVLFRYQNGRWSEHITFDVMDNQPVIPARNNLRLSAIGDHIFMTYLRTDGTENYSHDSLAITRSRTGIHWEQPWLLQVSETGETGALLKNGNYLYFANSLGGKSRAYSCGYVNSAYITHDISDYALAVGTRVGDTREIQITLANPEGVLNSILDSDTFWQLRVDLGWYVGNTPTTIQFMLAYVRSISRPRELPEDHRILIGTDVIGQIATGKADLVQEWENQQIGGDNFQSLDGTKYSGLRHTAGFMGHWEAENNILYLRSGDTPGVAFNVQTADVWNGSAQSAVHVGSTDSNDYAGVLFRGYNQYNMYFAAFDADNGRIILARRVDNTDTTLDSVSIGWTYGTWYYLKVVYRYNYVWVYSSTDGIAWTERITYEIPGTLPTVTWTWPNVPTMTGSMGYVGYGYSEEQTSYPPPPYYPPLPLPTPVETGPPTIVVVGTTVKGFYKTETFTGPDEGQPTWYEFNDGLGAVDLSIRQCMADPFHKEGRMLMITNDTGEVGRRGLWLWQSVELGGTGQWEKLYDTVSAMAKLLSDSIDPGDYSGRWEWVWYDATVDGLVYALYRNSDGIYGDPCIFKSTDGGVSWDAISILDGGFFLNGYHGVYTIHSYGDIVYAMVDRATSPFGHYIYQSTDGGYDWYIWSGRIGDTRNWQTYMNIVPANPQDFYMQSYESSPPAQYDWSLVLHTDPSFVGDLILGAGVGRPDTMWQDPAAAGTQRHLRIGDPSDPRLAYLYYTSNGFQGWPGATQSMTFAYWNICCYAHSGPYRWVDEDESNWRIYGANECNSVEDDTHTHHIFVADADASEVTVYPKAGSNVSTPPYTDSIPVDAGNICAYGIQVLG